MVFDCLSVLVLLCALIPVALMLGSRCDGCCGCTYVDDKPTSDPVGEGTWVPSGTWPDVTWSFQPNDGDDIGETWFFYGSDETSGESEFGLPSLDARNLCNWYSNKTTAPDQYADLAQVLNKRATRLPPENAVVHVYSSIAFPEGDTLFKTVYLWGNLVSATSGSFAGYSPAHDTTKCVVFNDTSVLFNGQIHSGGAMFNDSTLCQGDVYGGAVFNDLATSLEATIYDGVVLNDQAELGFTTTVYGGAVLNHESWLWLFTVVYDGAVLNDFANSYATIYGGAVFNDDSGNLNTVYDGATFNDTACSIITRIDGGVRKFVAHPTDLPTCNGTAPPGTDQSATCGCG